MKDGEKIYIALTKLSETIWDWMYSWEEIRKHINKQADSMRDLLDIIELATCTIIVRKHKQSYIL